jgi:hypothetical protein
MSRYVFQFLVLLSVAVLFALWQRNRITPAPIRNGFYVVRWPLTVRIVNAAFFITVLSMCGYFLFLSLAGGGKIPVLLWILVILLLSLACWGALTWRARNEYNESTLIAFQMIGKPRQFAVSDFTRTGPISWRGHEFSTETGDKIYVNSYQTGGPALIELLQRQVKETYYE